jgi:hypothetical protein
MAVVRFNEGGWKFISHSVYPFPVLQFHSQVCPPKGSPHNLSFSSGISIFVIPALCWRETVMHSELCSTYILPPPPILDSSISPCCSASFLLSHYSHDPLLVSCLSSTSFLQFLLADVARF